VASAFGGTFFIKCELIYRKINTSKKFIRIFTLARDSAFDKPTADSSPSTIFGLDCSRPATTTII
jgi:hypothetical protein